MPAQKIGWSIPRSRQSAVSTWRLHIRQSDAEADESQGGRGLVAGHDRAAKQTFVNSRSWPTAGTHLPLVRQARQFRLSPQAGDRGHSAHLRRGYPRHRPGGSSPRDIGDDRFAATQRSAGPVDAAGQHRQVRALSGSCRRLRPCDHGARSGRRDDHGRARHVDELDDRQPYVGADRSARVADALRPRAPFRRTGNRSTRRSASPSSMSAAWSSRSPAARLMARRALSVTRIPRVRPSGLLSRRALPLSPSLPIPEHRLANTRWSGSLVQRPRPWTSTSVRRTWVFP